MGMISPASFCCCPPLRFDYTTTALDPSVMTFLHRWHVPQCRWSCPQGLLACADHSPSPLQLDLKEVRASSRTAHCLTPLMDADRLHRKMLFELRIMETQLHQTPASKPMDCDIHGPSPPSTPDRSQLWPLWCTGLVSCVGYGWASLLVPDVHHDSCADKNTASYFFATLLIGSVNCTVSVLSLPMTCPLTRCVYRHISLTCATSDRILHGTILPAVPRPMPLPPASPYMSDISVSSLVLSAWCSDVISWCSIHQATAATYPLRSTPRI